MYQVTRIVVKGSQVLLYHKPENNTEVLLANFKKTDGLYIQKNSGSRKLIGITSNTGLAFSPQNPETAPLLQYPYRIEFDAAYIEFIVSNPASPWSPATVVSSIPNVFDSGYEARFEEVFVELAANVFGECCPDITIVGTTVFVDTEADLPASPQENVLYIAKDQGTEFRWDGTGWRQLVVEDAAITMYSYENFT